MFQTSYMFSLVYGTLKALGLSYMKNMLLIDMVLRKLTYMLDFLYLSQWQCELRHIIPLRYPYTYEYHESEFLTKFLTLCVIFRSETCRQNRKLEPLLVQPLDTKHETKPPREEGVDLSHVRLRVKLQLPKQLESPRLTSHHNTTWPRSQTWLRRRVLRQ